MTGLWIIVPSMLADVIDHNELQTGVRREGSFSSFFSWFLKLAASLSFGLSGLIVQWTGFDADLGGAQDPDVFPRMFAAMSLFPALMAIPIMVCIRIYPLTPEKMSEIRAELEDRRGEIN